MRFGVQGFGYRVWGLGFRVVGLGFGVLLGQHEEALLVLPLVVSESMPEHQVSLHRSRPKSRPKTVS